jgi:O-antigen ligase
MTAPTSHEGAHERERGPFLAERGSVMAERTAAFVVAAAIVIYLAIDGGGYDILVRQGFALVIWTLVAVGFTLGVLPRGRPRSALLAPGLAAAALLAWLLLSLIWTESSERTTAEVARLLGYLGLMTLALGSLNRRTFRTAAAGISVGVIAVTGIAVASRLYPETFPGAGNVAQLFDADRLDYPLDYWNAVGAWAAIAIAIAIAWSAHARLAAVRALSLATVPLAGACVYLTYSRGGVLGSGVAVLAVIALSRNRWTAFAHALVAGGGAAVAILSIHDHEQIADATGGSGGDAVAAVIVLAGLVCAGVALATARIGTDGVRLPRRTANYAVPAFLVLLVAGTLIAAHGPISRAWDQFRTQDRTDSSGSSRFSTAGGNRHNLWSSAFASFEAHPLDGTGPGTYEFWWSRDARDPEYVRNAHSLYLESLGETGLPGLVFLVLFLGGSLGAALHARRRIGDPDDLGASVAMCAAFCVFLVSAGVDWMWQVTALGAVALGGIAVAIAAGSEAAGSDARGSPLRPSLRATVVVVALAAVAVEVPGVVATQRIRASQAAARAGDLPHSRQLAEQAVDAMPWAATPYEQLALAEEDLGDLSAARRDVQHAIRNEPTNWRYPLLLARIEAEQGDRSAARRTFLRGRRLRPLSPSYSPSSVYGRQIFTAAEARRIERRIERRQSSRR